MVDDPALFGAVAAANALNDVFAMGGRPLVALSIAAFPEELPVETVRAIFDAAAAKVQESGAVLAGGHTIRDDEPKYGLAVVGTVHPAGLWRKSSAQPGDAVVLTKPLGTGLVLAGAARACSAPRRSGGDRPDDELNDRAADALRGFEPSAVTDVTGFGLFGHVHEMAERSGVRIELEADALPGLPGALAAAAEESAPGGCPQPGLRRPRARARRDAGGRRGARLRPADRGRTARERPCRQGPVLAARFAAEDSSCAHGRVVEERGGGLLMEAGARSAGFARYRRSGGVRVVCLRGARGSLPHRRLRRDRPAHRLRARVRELAELRRDVPAAQDYNAYVEFGNRVAGFVVGVTTLAAAVASFRVPGMPRWLLWSAVALPFTVLAQGVLGGSPSCSSCTR